MTRRVKSRLFRIVGSATTATHCRLVLSSHAHLGSQRACRRVSLVLSVLLDLAPIFCRFKKSGEFDKLRRELLANSQRSVRLCFAWFLSAEVPSKTGFDAFKTRIEEIARDRLQSGQMAYTAPELVHKVLLLNADRVNILSTHCSRVQGTDARN